MLVMSRKQAEQLLIDETIVVTVVSVMENKVLLGVEAPESIPIRRSELEIRAPSPARKSRRMGAG